ncbi:TetR/AcrR family transcriptional regulator [Micromonospora polyrhachis]|uniref:AcrR family transcriptional regulator n=1 Tax=Micromonospora polyrhachis TaxID=1282883 RepID=A0A7W7SYF8_9ACTN|nr:TetR family transcriptional regulator [Micromonospora polyrhachis]MBB4961950.1 AcrR family transcriptional regulator [Micromonospora polyrhachis]
MSTGLGLRERKKSATRQAIHQAALRLALAVGPDQVTVEAIADAAAVSRRTFSNYFASKEEALLYGDHLRIQRFLSLVQDRPQSETPWTALTEAAQQLYRQINEHDPQWIRQHQLIRQQPALLAQQITTYAAFEQDLAAEITTRLATTGNPLYPRIVAASFLAALRVAVRSWIDQPAGRTLTEVIQQVLVTAAGQFD